MRRYQESPCIACGKLVSHNGLARASHYARHIRDGTVVRVAVYTRRGKPCPRYHRYILTSRTPNGVVIRLDDGGRDA